MEIRQQKAEPYNGLVNYLMINYEGIIYIMEMVN